MSEILNCPFCDVAPKVRTLVEDYPAEDGYPAGQLDVWFYIACDGCAIELGAEYRSEVIELWNTRDGKAPPTED